MEDFFKQKLVSARSGTAPQTFAEALFGVSYFLPKNVNPSGPISKKVSTPTTSYTEKKQVIESLERFVDETLKTSEEEVIKLTPSAQITLKKPAEWTASSDEYQLEKPFLDLLLSNKKNVEVIFVTESLRNFAEISEELKGTFIDQLLCGFPLKTAELFERMILAMKLVPEEVILYPSENSGQDLFADLVKLTSEFRPKVIMSLGAKATSSVLKNKDRLSLIHGQFFSRETAFGEIQVVPLFHPNIIETNQNMKKTAWTDMQKVMKFLKKIP